jgi:hypothetical protein
MGAEWVRSLRDCCGEAQDEVALDGLQHSRHEISLTVKMV